MTPVTADSPVPGTPTDPEPPHKRLRLTLDLEAHDLDDMTARLNDIVTRLCVERRESFEWVSGSYVIHLTCNPGMNEDRFIDELDVWIERRRANRV